MRRSITFAVAIALLSSSCVKDGLEVADLNTNPFDAEYVGPAVFEVTGSEFYSYVLNGQTRYGLDVDVRVRTELFLRNTTYTWRVKRSTDADWSSFQFNQPTTTLSLLDITPGQEYCWQFQLANQGSIGTGNTVCATAE